MNAVVLAGGFGSRLAPITDKIPKPMVKVANKPMIDYTVSHLYNVGIKDFVFTLNYKPEKIIDWCIGYSGILCRFSLETNPLGTLGGVKAVEDFLHDVFFVLSGDVLENVDLSKMLDFHLSSGAEVTIATIDISDISELGAPIVDDNGKVTNFIEKSGVKTAGLANSGIYIVNKSVIKSLPKDVKMDFAKDLFPVLVKKNQLYAFKHDGYWQDAGTMQNYYNANFDLKEKVLFSSAPNRHRHKSYSKTLGSPHNSLVSYNSTIDAQIFNSIVGDNCYVAPKSYLENSIVLDGTTVTGNHINCIVGSGFSVPILDKQPNFDSFRINSNNLFTS